MSKKKRQRKKAITLERIMAQPVAKRLYVSLIPIDNLLGDMKLEVECGQRDEEDAYYLRIQDLREGLVQILEEVLRDTNE